MEYFSITSHLAPRDYLQYYVAVELKDANTYET